jgi:hypothetical protein
MNACSANLFITLLSISTRVSGLVSMKGGCLSNVSSFVAYLFLSDKLNGLVELRADSC